MVRSVYPVLLACLVGGAAMARAEEQTIALPDGTEMTVLIEAPQKQAAPQAPLALIIPGGPGSRQIAEYSDRLFAKPLAERGWLAAVLVSPDGKSFIGENGLRADQVATILLRREDVREGRVLIGGGSNGGIASIQIASLHPARYAAVIAMPGLIGPGTKAQALRGMPIYLRVGAKDELNWAGSYAGAVRMLEKAGAKVDAKLLPDQGHNLQPDWAELDPWLEEALGAEHPRQAWATKAIEVFAGDDSAYRTWTSRMGASIEARIVSTDGRKVVLEQRDGKKVDILVRLLSDADQAHLKSLER